MDMFRVASEAPRTLKVNENKCRSSLAYNMLTNDIAYYLVKKGVNNQ